MMVLSFLCSFATRNVLFGEKSRSYQLLFSWVLCFSYLLLSFDSSSRICSLLSDLCDRHGTFIRAGVKQVLGAEATAQVLRAGVGGQASKSLS